MNMVSEKIASILFYMSSPLSIFLHCGVGATKVIGYLTDYCVCVIFIFAHIFYVNCSISDSFNSFKVRGLHLAHRPMVRTANNHRY